jgi:hypothetical protein
MSHEDRFTGSSGGLTASELELIAELVDGALDDKGRHAALRLLNESSAAYEVYVDAVATLRGTGHHVVGGAIGEAASGPAVTGVSSGKPSETVTVPGSSEASGFGARLVGALRSTPSWRAVVPVAAAAGLALALVLRPDTPLATELAIELGPTVLAVALGPESPGAQLPPTGYEHPLGAVRGGTTPASELGRAFRLGVRVMDTEAQLVAGRDDGARASHRAALDLLGALEAPPTVVAPFRDYVEVLDATGRARMDEDIERWLSAGGARLMHYRFGKTAEALRFAIVAGESELIRPSSRRMAETIPADLAPAAVDSLAALLELTRAGDGSSGPRGRIVALLSGAMSTAGR